MYRNIKKDKPIFYRLAGKTPVPCTEQEFHEWRAKKKRKIARDEVGSTTISTVFLGVDHTGGDGDVPILFETMVFKDDAEIDVMRYPTWKAAEAGHHAMLKKYTPKK